VLVVWQFLEPEGTMMFFWFLIGFISAAVATRLLITKRSVSEAQAFPRPLELSDSDDVLKLEGRLILACAVVAILLAIIVDFAFSSDRFPWVLDSILWIRSVFLGGRFQSIFWGLVCGAIFQAFNESIRNAAKQVFDATVGNKETTAWALQGALAVFLIAAAVFFVKPDLLNYIRSVEYGNLKATFAEQTSTAKVANLSYKDFLWDFTLNVYERLDTDFQNRSAPRSLAEQWVEVDGLSKNANERLYNNRKDLIGLFSPFVTPVMQSLICLERHHAIGSAAYNPVLFAYAHQWQAFVETLKGGPDHLDVLDMAKFLGRIDGVVHEIKEFSAKVVPECVSIPANKSSFRPFPVSDIFPGLRLTDAEKITEKYNESRAIIRKGYGVDYQLTMIIDPYLIGALADLIAIITDQNQKAEFLTRSLDKFKTSDDRLTPGIINLFYQIADAQLRSENWPPPAILGELDYSLRGVKKMIDRSSRYYNDDDKTKEILKIFARNLFIVLSEKLAVFNQRALAGEQLTDAVRQDWLVTYAKMFDVEDARPPIRPSAYGRSKRSTSW
jgi:hypothetical protein